MRAEPVAVALGTEHDRVAVHLMPGPGRDRRHRRHLPVERRRHRLREGQRDRRLRLDRATGGRVGDGGGRGAGREPADDRRARRSPTCAGRPRPTPSRPRPIRASVTWSLVGETRWRAICWALGPYETAATGLVKCSCSGAPVFSVTYVCLTLAVGVDIASDAALLRDPASHEIQPGRLTTTAIVTRSPAGIVPFGQIRSPRTTTGIRFPRRPPVTTTLEILPPPSGIPTLASACESGVRLAEAEEMISAPTPAPMTTTSSTPARAHRPRRLRRGGAPRWIPLPAYGAVVAETRAT